MAAGKHWAYRPAYKGGIGPDEAFAELVRRYVNLVFSTARRMLGNEGHRAEDIAQEVFLHLARQAAHLSPETVLSSWLHRDTYYTTLELLRADRRRRIREGKAMNDFEGAGPEVIWERLSPILDHALQQLADTDRKTILWRFFEDRPLQEVGKQLGLSESGASRRVSAALEKLRAVLVRHGITTTASALALVMTQSAIQAAPPPLASVIVAGSCATITASTTKLFSLKSLLLHMKTKFTVGLVLGAILLGTVGTLAVYQARKHQATAAMAQEAYLEEQQAHLQPVGPILIKLIQYAEKHTGTLPKSLTEVAVVDLRFELVSQGVLPMSPGTAPTPILREKHSWRTATGKVGRVYGYSDGHAQVLAQGDPGFTE